VSPAAVGLVLVAHSERLADGLAEVAQQMAPDVLIRTAGGVPDGRLGTSYERVERAVLELLDSGVEAVVVLTDLGSATLTAEAVIESLDDQRASLVEAPLVEGTVAAAVASQTGGDWAAVERAALRVGASYGRAALAEKGLDVERRGRTEGVRARTLYLTNRFGLHARPAALLARAASAFDAEVRLNGVRASSVLELMDLMLDKGAELRLTASGPEAEDALDAVEELVGSHFGEE
jgi:PTS hybrid protein